MSYASGSTASFAYRWFDEVWNQNRHESIVELAAADCVVHGISSRGADMTGIPAFEEFQAGFRRAFSEIRIVVNEHLEGGDRVFSRWTASLTHTGSFQGIPATNRKVAVNGMSIFRIADGKIAEGWDNWDVLGLYEQLGACVALRDETGALRELSAPA